MKNLRTPSCRVSVRKELQRHRWIRCAKLGANYPLTSVMRNLCQRVERRTCCVGNTLNTLSSNTNDTQWRWLRSYCSHQQKDSKPKHRSFTNQFYEKDGQNSEQRQNHDIVSLKNARIEKKFAGVRQSVQRCKQSSSTDVGNRIVHEYSESLCAVYAPTHEIVKAVWEKRRDENQARLDVGFISAKKSAERQLQGAIVPFLYIDLYCSLIILIGNNLRSTTSTVLSERLAGLSWAEVGGSGQDILNGRYRRKKSSIAVECALCKHLR